jgi:S-DNA-T family DNA segregation ATPase FtsK/SpoIIIE
MAEPKTGKNNNKKGVSDFLKDKPNDRNEKISGKDIFKAASLKNETTRRILGFLLLTFSVVTFISFTSFFFSWKSDQSFLADSQWEQYIEETGDIKNAMGYLGARWSYNMIHNGFGLAAFAILPYMVFMGLYLLLNFRPFSLLRILLHTIIFMTWFSLFLGFVFQNMSPLLGGTFGYFGIQQLQSGIGVMGAFVFLAVFAFIYYMVIVNANPFESLQMKAAQFEEDFKSEETGIQEEQHFEPKIFEDITEDPHANEILDSSDEEVLEDPFEDSQAEDIPEEELPVEPIRLKKREEIPSEDASTEDPRKVETTSGFTIEDNTAIEDESVDENLAEKQVEQEYGSINTEYDPRADLSNYHFPTLDLLTDYGSQKHEIDYAEIEKSKELIEETLLNYKIGIAKISASVGPTVTLYEIVPAPGVKISKIKNLEDDIALSLAALGIRIIAPIPGRGTIGIEVPNTNPVMVPMRSIIASKKFQECEYQLPVALGKTISNEIFIADLAKMPHLLMAGATGQGKSVGLNAILVSLLYKKHPAYVKFVLVDPKKVELTLFNKIERHFLAKLPGDADAIITDNQKVVHTLNSLCVEMDNRYKLLQEAMVRNIIEYNKKFLDRKLNPENGHRFMPYIVVVIDEVADLMMTAGKEIEIPIARLAQLARAIGIHLILATQRPSVNVITGMIKANFPARIAFRVTSKIDSRTILDGNGADQLIGKGDMLYNGGNEMVRLQCPFVDTPEVEKICEFIGEQRAYATAYILPEVQEEDHGGGGGDFDSDSRDTLFEDAARIIVQNQVGSTSMIQRKLKIGYNRAGRLMDQLEDAGVVGQNLGSKPRQVLIPDEMALEDFLSNLF